MLETLTPYFTMLPFGAAMVIALIGLMPSPFPALVGKAMAHLLESRYEAGQLDAKAAVRKALGLNS